MPVYKISNLFISLDEFDESDESNPLLYLVQKKWGIAKADLTSVTILKRSLDARKKNAPHYCYTIAVETKDALRNPGNGIEPLKDNTSEKLVQGSQTLPHRPIIVGTGPAGLFAAWLLAEYGYNPVVLERGPEVKTRSRKWFEFLKGEPFDPEANLLFGEGGAGTYSDGKLTTRVHDARVQEALKIFVECGAPADTLYDSKPHLGSNFLPAIVRNMRKRILDLGGTFHFDCAFERMIFSEKSDADQKNLTAIHTQLGEMATEVLLFAPGHSARDTYRSLHAQEVFMSAKPFQIGVRIEHPQELIDRAQFGAYAGHKNLPAAEYALLAKHAADGCDLYSFCMCPGGEILPATERPGYLCVNGASKRARSSPFANSGLVITLDPTHFENDPMKGIALQEAVERKAFELAGGDFSAPGQRVVDYLKDKVSESLLPTSYPLPVRPVNLKDFLPTFVDKALRNGLPQMDRKIRGYAGDQAMLLGPEARTCSPLRIDRDEETRQSVNVHGLYPMGEGAGYAGGIMSAAVDGLKSAQAVIERFKRPTAQQST